MQMYTKERYTSHKTINKILLYILYNIFYTLTIYKIYIINLNYKL